MDKRVRIFGGQESRVSQAWDNGYIGDARWRIVISYVLCELNKTLKRMPRTSRSLFNPLPSLSCLLRLTKLPILTSEIIYGRPRGTDGLNIAARRLRLR